MLIDTNVFIEIAKNQDRHQDCKDFLDAIANHAIPGKAYVTKFAFHSVCVLLAEENPLFLKEIMLMVQQGIIEVAEMNNRQEQ